MTETMQSVGRLQSIISDSNAVDGFQTVTIASGGSIYAFLDTLNSTEGILAAEPYYYVYDSVAMPVGDKIIVAFAGPLFSFLLAILFAVIVWQVGKPVNVEGEDPTLGWVVPDGPAWKAGLRFISIVASNLHHELPLFVPPHGPL